MSDIVAIDIETTYRYGRASPYLDDLLIIAVNDGGKISLYDSVDQIEGILSDPNILKIFHNGAFDIQFLEYCLFGEKISNIWDTMIMERLLSAGVNEPCDYGAVVKRYCDISLDKSTRDTFLNHSGRLSRVQQEYAKNDVRYLPDIYKQQHKSLSDRSMDEVADLENSLVPVVARMELAGIGFNQSAWDAICDEERALLPALEKDAQIALGGTFTYDLFTGNPVGSINLNSPSQLLRALHNIGIDVDNTNNSTLEKVSHPEVQLILDYREHAKRLQWDYPKYVNSVTGRIHPNFVQTGAATGRFSCKDPNLQNVPNDPKFRRMFVAKPSYKLITADYAQQELRVLAEYSKDPALIKSCRTADPHLENARMIYSDPTIKKSDDRRRTAKACSFALVYGAGSDTLGRGAGLSREDSAKVYKKLHDTYAGVDTWGDASLAFLKQNGYVTTLGGRRRYFPGAMDSIFKYRTVARNTPIQGTSADMMKRAIVYTYEALQKYDAQVLLCVHDELVVEAHENVAREVAGIVETQMKRAGAHYVKCVPIEAEAVIEDMWTK